MKADTFAKFVFEFGQDKSSDRKRIIKILKFLDKTWEEENANNKTNN